MTSTKQTRKFLVRIARPDTNSRVTCDIELSNLPSSGRAQLAMVRQFILSKYNTVEGEYRWKIVSIHRKR